MKNLIDEINALNGETQDVLKSTVIEVIQKHQDQALDEALQAIEKAAHFCRGMGMFESRIPADIKKALISKADDLDAKCREIAPDVYGDEA